MSRLILLVWVVSLLGACAAGPRKPTIAPDARHFAQVEQAPLPAVPLTPDILYQMTAADIAVQRGQYQVAADLYLQLAGQTRDRRLAELATRAAVLAGDDKSATTAGELWLQLDPGSAPAHEFLAMSYIREERYDAALEQLKALLAAGESRPDKGYMIVASLLSRERNKQATLDLMQRLVSGHEDDPSAMYSYSFLAVNAGQLDLAQEKIDQVLKIEPASSRAILLRARILQLKGNGAELLAYLQEVVNRYPEDLNVRLTYARALVGKQRFEEAYRQYEILVRKAPDNADVLFTYAVLAFQFDRIDEAEEYLLKLNREGVQVVETSYYLGRIAAIRGQHDAAIAWFDVIENGQYYLEAQLGTAYVLASKGDLDGARQRLQAVTTTSPADRLRVYLTEGTLLHNAGRYAEEIEVYNAALENMPGNPDLLFSRGMAADKLDNLELFEQDMREVLKQEPDNASALNALGYVLADRTTRYQEALNYIERALALRPNDYYILDSYGWVLYRLGKFDDAISYLRRALEVSPDSEIAAHLGEVLWVTGDQQAARDVWKRALDATPQNPVLIDTIRRFDKP